MSINGYDIISEIHRGPVTTVYQAIHRALERRVLLKVLNTQWTKEEDLIERIRREANICARIDHPNIVKIYDFGRSGESVYISMEYVEGTTLEDLIQQNKKISFQQIADISSQILGGLSYAHRNNIIHRDIKPSNIMISAEGRIKITDFGLAVVSDLPAITGQDQAVGSPAYMSPEQVLGEDLDNRSDLFSLGVTLYEICANKSPFKAENIGHTIQNILTVNPENLSRLNPDLPEWYTELIHTLLAKKREDRPQNSDLVFEQIRIHYKKENLSQPIPMTNHSPEPSAVKNGKFVKYMRKSRFQPRMFLWVFPAVTILTYLIFSQTEEISSAQSTEFKTGDTSPVSISPDSLRLTAKNKAQDQVKSNGTVSGQITSRETQIKETEKSRTDNKTGNQNTVTAPAEEGQLYIIAKPWAEIYIDRIFHDQTPLSKPVKLEAGSHLIELKNPNYTTYAQNFEIASAQTETLVVEMKMTVGFIDIRVLPWAKIYVDGEYRETSPLENPLTLASGEHILTLINPNYSDIQDTIVVSPGETLNKKYNFLK